jgi:hypothetical protein
MADTKSLDIDSLIKGMSSPEVGKNSESVMSMIKEVNSTLSELTKTIGFLDRTGLKPLLVRGIGAKLGIDAESPLQSETGFKPRSNEHQNVFEHLNIMSVEELKKMFTETKKGEDDVQA